MTHGTPTPYEPPPGERDRPGAGTRRGDARAGRRRTRAPRLLPLVVAAWVVLEIWLLTLVGGAAGGLTVLALLLGGLVLGALVIKWAGRRAWRQLAAALQPGADPAAAAAAARDQRGGNALAMLGGLLLMVPGLVSDALGLLCLFPPTAALLRRGGERLLDRGELGVAMRQARSAQQQSRIHRPGGTVVQGEVVRDDEPPAH
ncbi:FxsA family membrane protein [Streptomyces sp. JJ36]|uniref:FxsA family membrane protein n=1 Tax=Streptomyces sp. JJ36 TaxID=2736645 RepID=UPI001F3D2C82|nr:FxsA family membrane protein [Streptomyces sp. JJ36]MCF6524597.1 FxsA family protein [Streptomyces sp. JJ36]